MLKEQLTASTGGSICPPWKWHRAPQDVLCALCEGKAQEMWLRGPTPNKDLLAWLPLKPPKPFPGCSKETL